MDRCPWGARSTDREGIGEPALPAVPLGLRRVAGVVIEEPDGRVWICSPTNGFGDNALLLTLRAYVDSIGVRLTTIAELNRAINRAFADAGVNIAFP